MLEEENRRLSQRASQDFRDFPANSMVGEPPVCMREIVSKGKIHGGTRIAPRQGYDPK